MRTSRPFSTISYNTDKFLQQVLNDLIKRDAICFWAYVTHYPEEGELKMHKHLYIVPNGMVQTNDIRDLLEEVDPTNPLGLPLKCMEMRASKFDDWYLYGLHDSGYLATKGQKRKYHYQATDVVASNPESLHEQVSTIDYAKYRKTQDFVDAILRGVPFHEMVRAGNIPVNQFWQWKQMADFLLAVPETENGATPEVDPETGEVLNPPQN